MARADQEYDLLKAARIMKNRLVAIAVCGYQSGNHFSHEVTY